MAISSLTERQKTLIVSNVVKACENIKKLNGTGYKFLYLCSGFIAHYNRYGFIQAYNEPESLKFNLIKNSKQNQWDNFRPGDQDYDYYMSKKDVYNRILAKIL